MERTQSLNENRIVLSSVLSSLFGYTGLQYIPLRGYYFALVRFFFIMIPALAFVVGMHSWLPFRLYAVLGPIESILIISGIHPLARRQPHQPIQKMTLIAVSAIALLAVAYFMFVPLYPL